MEGGGKNPGTKPAPSRRGRNMTPTPTDRRILDALLAEINDPATTDERREDCRDDFSSITNAYVIAEMFEGEDSAWDIMEKEGIPAVPVEVVTAMFGDKIVPEADGFSYRRKG